MKFLVIMLLLFANVASAQHSKGAPHHWRQLLAEQGFTGAVTGKVELDRIGEITCGAERIQVYFHSWEQTDMARHAHYRLVFIAPGNNYIGQYSVSDRPSGIVGREIHFDAPEQDGIELVCNESGLPSTVLVGGEETALQK